MYVCSHTRPKVIQSSYMVINNHGYVDLIEHLIVHLVHKTEEDIKASAVYPNCQDMCSDSPNLMKKMAGSSAEDQGGPSED